MNTNNIIKVGLMVIQDEIRKNEDENGNGGRTDL